MDNIKRYTGIILLLAVAGGLVYTFIYKQKETMKITYSTSDAGKLKGEISIALDSWIGYFPFRSPVFGKLMRDAGYRLKIIDDEANYPERMKMLKKGDIDFAVCTVDSYLLNGKAEQYPGAIISVIDESKGGDAIVSWKDTIPNIDTLKYKKDVKIAYTPASPSEHLLKSVIVHFGIPLPENNSDWRIEVGGAEEAYKKLIAKEADIAIMWEPHVSQALSTQGTIKLLGSEDVEKLIIDVLLVNRQFAQQKPELVGLFLKNHFECLSIYQSSPQRLIHDIQSQINSEKKQITYMLKGVDWIEYPRNLRWFGINSSGTTTQPEIIESINSTLTILINSKDFSENPLQDGDPYTVVNSSFIKKLYNSLSNTRTDRHVASRSLSRSFTKLDQKKWDSLKIIGGLKLKPIKFRSGTSILDEAGMKQISAIVNDIKHYPNYRILIKGHSGIRGDLQANRKLSLDRARVVKKELVMRYRVNTNRIMTKGMGPKEPLPKHVDESDRSYNNRLKRVELLLLSEK